MKANLRMFRGILLAGGSMATLTACATTAETVCARKAELIGAAEATIKLLNETCPIRASPAQGAETEGQ